MSVPGHLAQASASAQSSTSASYIHRTTSSNPRLAALESKRATLTRTFSDLSAQRAALVSTLSLTSTHTTQSDCSAEETTQGAVATAQAAIKSHIKLLTRYNEVKDVAQGLMGLIAERRGVQVKVVMEEFGMDDKD